MDDQKQSSQSRFLLAATLSMGVLFAWSYFFAPKPKPVEPNANVAVATQTPAPPTAPIAGPQPATVTLPSAIAPDTNPNKTITIKSPIYEVKLDTKGAVATSWILVKNVHKQHEQILAADGSTDTVKKPLELVSLVGLKQVPRAVPFQLATDDANLDLLINDRNFRVSEVEDTITLKDSESKQIDFVLQDPSGLEVTKSFVFHADSYVTGLSVKATRNSAPIPNTKILVGPSIGDQAIEVNNYYHIEPEAVVYKNGKAERHTAASMITSGDSGNIKIDGQADWAAVGDTYFGMALVPAQPAPSIEYRSTKYEVDVAPFYSGVFAWVLRNQTTKVTKHLLTAYVPVNSDGSMNNIYTGSKDYFTLSEYNERLSKESGRAVDIEDFINFGYLKVITKPIAVPLLWTLNKIYGFVGNYGIAIIIFTLIFYSLFFPLRWYQSKSFKKASANAPKMKEVQERMKELQRKGVPADDPRMREVQMEQLKMMKGAIPLGGCLPLLMQIPLFIALYVAVTISLDFRHASFLWLPDLSAGDPWHLLEFLFAGSMAGSMVLTPTTPAITDEQKMQQKMMTYMMPAMMLFVMWGTSSGLLLYWFCGNIVSFIQQFIINRLNKTNEPPTDEKSAAKNLKKAKLQTS